MTNLGPCAYYLRMIVTRDRANRIIRFRQAVYVERVLRENDMWEAKPVSTLMETLIKIVSTDDGFQAE